MKECLLYLPLYDELKHLDIRIDKDASIESSVLFSLFLVFRFEGYIFILAILFSSSSLRRCSIAAMAIATAAFIAYDNAVLRKENATIIQLQYDTH